MRKIENNPAALIKLLSIHVCVYINILIKSLNTSKTKECQKLQWFRAEICLVFNAGRVILSSVQVLAPMVLKLRHMPMLTEIGYSLRRGRGGSLDCIYGVCKHSGPPVFLVPFRKDLANQKWLPALGIEPASFDRESYSWHLLANQDLDFEAWLEMDLQHSARQ